MLIAQRHILTIGGNGGGMLRAALGTALLSVVTNLIETANLSK